MTADRPLLHGTAVALARIAHFRQLEPPEAHELDVVARVLMGRVRDAAEVMEHLADELDLLWSLDTSGPPWSESDLDELTDDDWMRYSFATQQQELEHRHAATIARLTADIEHYIEVCRVIRTERERPVRTAVSA